MARKCLIYALVLVSFAAYAYATCNTYENSRVAHFENGQIACGYTGPGCQECYEADDWGVLTCWSNWPYTGCRGFNDPAPYVQ